MANLSEGHPLVPVLREWGDILRSIDEGLFRWEFRETIAEGDEGALTSSTKELHIHDYHVRFAKLINDMRNIKMTMSRMQLNSKFVNNMLPEWGRFISAVKLSRGLRDSNYDQLYAYLKQHEAYANENKLMYGWIERSSERRVGECNPVKQGRLSATTAMENRSGLDVKNSFYFLHGGHDNVVG
ncbi:hypothetical protein Tco_1191845 [Tanacetum coccineum]